MQKKHTAYAGEFEDLQIVEIARDYDTCCSWCMATGLLNEEPSCSECGGRMCLTSDCTRIDKYRWVCSSRRTTHCNGRRTLRANSFFEHAHLSPQEMILLLFYHFLQQHTIKYTAKVRKLSLNTVGNYYRDIRNMISVCIQTEYRSTQLGTQPSDEDGGYPAVEIDESLFGHTPGVEPKIKRQIWVLGIYDRATQEVRLFVLGKHRRAEDILPYIYKHVATCCSTPTRIYTDMWKAYSALAYHGYKHVTINHSKGFGHAPRTTNHIESTWSEIKAISGYYSGMNGSLHNIQAYIDTGIWRRRYKTLSEEEKIHELIAVLLSNYTCD